MQISGAGRMTERSSAKSAALIQSWSDSLVDADGYTYLCLDLRSRELSPGERRRLEEEGIECLMEAGDYRAYGIVPAGSDVLRRLSEDPVVTGFHQEEPPAGK